MSLSNLIRKNNIADAATDDSLQIEMIRAWLHKIGEPDEDHHLVLDKCRIDPEAMEYFLRHVRGEYEASNHKNLMKDSQ